MVEPSSQISLISTDPIQLGLAIIISGGLVAGTYEWIRYLFNKRREERMDTARKKKMEKIANCAPYYNQLVVYSFSFSNAINQGLPDAQLCLFHLSNILNIYYEIFRQFGGIQLDSLLAEKIVVGLGNTFLSVIGYEMGISVMHRIRGLVQNSNNYHDFRIRIIPRHRDLYI
jgi:hypothetical protein